MAQSPSIDQLLRDVKARPDAPKEGMYLIHNGVVRLDSRAAARNTEGDRHPVTGLSFS